MNEPTFVEVRRKDRAVEDGAWIEAFLRAAPFGVTASVFDGQPRVNTNLFVYDPQRRAIYYHSSDQGSTHTALQGGASVAFTAAQMGRLIPAARSRGFSVEYSSVVAYGQAHIVSDPDEAMHGLKLLMAKYAPHLQPGQDYRAMQPEELEGVAVYRLDIQRWSAKRKQAPPDAPGAYAFEPA